MTEAKQQTDPLLLEATYSSEFLRQEYDKGQAASDNAWVDLLTTKPKLYFDKHPQLVTYDVFDQRRHYCTPGELQHAAKIIEERTEQQMSVQRQLLAKWNRAATPFQTRWRGVAARMLFQHMRIRHSWELLEAYFVRRFKLRDILRNISAKVLQRRIKAHWKQCVLERWALKVLHRSSQLFLFRLRRYYANYIIIRWYLTCLYRRNLLRAAFRLSQKIHIRRRNQQATQEGGRFLLTRQRHIEYRQEVYLQEKPEAVLMHRMLQRRKHDLQNYHLQQANLKSSKKLAHRRNRKVNKRKPSKKLPPLAQRSLLLSELPIASDTMMAVAKSRTLPSNATRYTLAGLPATRDRKLF